MSKLEEIEEPKDGMENQESDWAAAGSADLRKMLDGTEGYRPVQHAANERA